MTIFPLSWCMSLRPGKQPHCINVIEELSCNYIGIPEIPLLPQSPNWKVCTVVYTKDLGCTFKIQCANLRSSSLDLGAQILFYKLLGAQNVQRCMFYSPSMHIMQTFELGLRPNELVDSTWYKSQSLE